MPEQLPLKESIHIHMIPAEEYLNMGTGLEIPGCWMAVLRKQEVRTKCTNSQLLVTPADELPMT